MDLHVYLYLQIMLSCANVAAMDTCNRHTTNTHNFTEESQVHFMSSICICEEFRFCSADAKYCSYVWLPYATIYFPGQSGHI